MEQTGFWQAGPVSRRRHAAGIISTIIRPAGVWRHIPCSLLFPSLWRQRVPCKMGGGDPGARPDRARVAGRLLGSSAGGG